MENLQEVKIEALKVKKSNNMDFVTIWKTGKLFGFNFDKKEIGFFVKEFGVKRTVVSVL